jgi:hypothetical protein
METCSWPGGIKSMARSLRISLRTMTWSHLQVENHMSDLARADLGVLPARTQVQNRSSILIESTQDTDHQHEHWEISDPYILPVSASTLTSSGEINSGLYSRLHSIVPLILFFASCIFHFDARMYRAWHPGSARKRASQG